MLKVNLSLPLPTTEYILKYLTDQQIFEYYLNGYRIGSGNISSPLRDNDNDPSFSIFYSSKHNKLLFKDFGGSRGDCFIFVSKLLRLDYAQTLCRIAADFNLPDVFTGEFKKSRKKVKSKKEVDYSKFDNPTIIQVKTKPYTQEEILWWNSFGISLSTLQTYNIFSLEKIFVNGNIISKPFMFGFLEKYNGMWYWKIYSPKDKEFKWISSAPYGCIQGFTRLPKEGDILIIEKAYKDFLPIIEHTEYASCGLQNEGVFIKPKVMEDLHRRFKRIYFLGDNDSPGLEFSEKICKHNNLIPIFIPCVKYKNFSDLIYGIKDIPYSVKILNKLIKNN